MIWLELRMNNTTYNPGWNFQESVWAPTQTQNHRNWPFWNLIKKVVKGDIIFHLINTNNGKIFTGYSTALTDGYLTNSIPTQKKHEWDFISTYYKAELSNFQPLTPTISLLDFFQSNNQELRDYFSLNKRRQDGKKRLFYVIQSERLQCLNGAYFSEFTEKLPELLVNNYGNIRNNNIINENINTGVAVSEIERRIGHQTFADNVKSNFNSQCCFPNCNVEGRGFLVSGHIARWTDNEPLRGHTGNGLCFCLMHDKAFEKGYFTLNEHYQVVLVNTDFNNSPWLEGLLRQGENLEIKPRQINPLIEALHQNWERIGYQL